MEKGGRSSGHLSTSGGTRTPIQDPELSQEHLYKILVIGDFGVGE